MRKLFLSVCVALLSIVAVQAQNLGDRMVIEGVEGYVFYLDESGLHGLMISRPAIVSKNFPQLSTCPKATQKEIDDLCNIAEKTGEDPVALRKSLESNNFYKASSVFAVPKPKDINKTREKAYSVLKDKVGDDGKENAKIYAEYCKDNGLSMAEVFPEMEWALRLGNGWFIPGIDELELLGIFYQGGLGTKYALKQKQWCNIPKEKIQDPACQKYLFNTVFYGLQSSSIDKNGRRVVLQYGTKGGYHVGLTSSYTSKALKLCAIHEF